jgi:ketosteroid isomerase-like protein
MKNLFIIAIVILALAGCTAKVKHEVKTESAPTEIKMQPAEFADLKYADIGKKLISSLSRGDMAGYISDYADNAVYQFNNGDSIAGKPAIYEYWNKRRTEFIDSLTFSNEIWLPIKVNQPQSVEAHGVWLLGWYQVNATYKTTGKRMVQWMHIDLHFDANDKIDRVVQYLDRVPINEAMKK